MLIREKLELIQRATPNRSAYGQLYKNKSELVGSWGRVTLWCVFVSSDDTHLVRNHLFDTLPKHRDAEQWHQWFTLHLSKIHRDSVLRGLRIRTGRDWSVHRILGWVADQSSGARKRASRKPKSAALSRGRNKAKRKGKSRG